MIHAVIFDLDGTLINSLPGIAASLNRVLKKNGLPTHEEDLVRTFIGDGIAKLVQRAVPKDLPHQDIEKLVTLMMQDYAATWQNGSSPYEKVNETLQKLLDQDICIAVFSNKPHIYCQEITDTLFPNIPFTRVLGQRDGIPVKPDPQGAYDIAKDMNIPITSIAYLGDSTIDVYTAKNAGMLAIAASWGYHDLPALEATQPDHLIHSITDLLSIISP